MARICRSAAFWKVVLATSIKVSIFIFKEIRKLLIIIWQNLYRGKLRDMFPITSFAGGLVLSDSGVDLLSKLLEMDPAKVSMSHILVYTKN